MTIRKRHDAGPGPPAGAPDLKVIVAPTTVGILAAAQVVSQAGKSADVKNTGLGFPSRWRPSSRTTPRRVRSLERPDLGYLAYNFADQLVKGTITGAAGETVTVPSLNGGQPYTIDRQQERSSSVRRSRSTRTTSMPRTGARSPQNAIHRPTPTRSRPRDASGAAARPEPPSSESISDAPPVRPEAEYRRRHADVWPSCSPTPGRRAPRTIRSSSTARTCSATSRSRTSRRFEPRCGAARRTPAGSPMAALIQPAHRSRDRVPPPAGRGVRTRLTRRPSEHREDFP